MANASIPVRNPQQKSRRLKISADRIHWRAEWFAASGLACSAAAALENLFDLQSIVPQLSFLAWISLLNFRRSTITFTIMRQLRFRVKDHAVFSVHLL